MLWCEFGDCSARYTSEEALSERDLRAWALAAGWRYDASGRLACPGCARSDPSFRGGHPGKTDGSRPDGHEPRRRWFRWR